MESVKEKNQETWLGCRIQDCGNTGIFLYFNNKLVDAEFKLHNIYNFSKMHLGINLKICIRSKDAGSYTLRNWRARQLL